MPVEQQWLLWDDCQQNCQGKLPVAKNNNNKIKTDHGSQPAKHMISAVNLAMPSKNMQFSAHVLGNRFFCWIWWGFRLKKPAERRETKLADTLDCLSLPGNVLLLNTKQLLALWQKAVFSGMTGKVIYSGRKPFIWLMPLIKSQVPNSEGLLQMEIMSSLHPAVDDQT